jgi:hypothetical protein
MDGNSKVSINFIVHRAGRSEVDRTVTASRSDKWEFKRVAIKYRPSVMRDTEGRVLGLDTFVEDVIKDGTYAVFIESSEEVAPRKRLIG